MVPLENAPETCPTRQDLLQSIVSAMDQVLDLGCMEIAAMTNGFSGAELERIGHDLDQALRARRELLEGYRSHVSSHGCR